MKLFKKFVVLIFVVTAFLAGKSVFGANDPSDTCSVCFSKQQCNTLVEKESFYMPPNCSYTVYYTKCIGTDNGSFKIDSIEKDPNCIAPIETIIAHATGEFIRRSYYLLNIRENPTIIDPITKIPKTPIGWNCKIYVPSCMKLIPPNKYIGCKLNPSDSTRCCEANYIIDKVQDCFTIIEKKEYDTCNCYSVVQNCSNTCNSIYYIVGQCFNYNSDILGCQWNCTGMGEMIEKTYQGKYIHNSTGYDRIKVDTKRLMNNDTLCITLADIQCNFANNQIDHINAIKRAVEITLHNTYLETWGTDNNTHYIRITMPSCYAPLTNMNLVDYRACDGDCCSTIYQLAHNGISVVNVSAPIHSVANNSQCNANQCIVNACEQRIWNTEPMSKKLEINETNTSYFYSYVVPMPAQNSVSIFFQTVENGVFETNLYDAVGNFVQKFSFEKLSYEASYNLNTGSFTNGLYTYVISKDGKTVFSGKLIISK